MNKHLFRTLLISLTVLQFGCLDENTVSQDLTKYQDSHTSTTRIGQVRFMLDDLGSLTLNGLVDIRIMPAKVYETALLIAESENFPFASESVPLAMEKFGFIRPEKIENWNSTLAPEPKVQVLGYVKTMIEKEILGMNIKIQAGNLTCSACHSGRVFGADGLPTNNVWLGTPNTSIDYDSYLAQIYRGLKVAASDNKGFLQKIKIAYPDIDPLELSTIKKFILPAINKKIKKMASMDRVLPYANGGPGMTNGLSAFKRASKLHEHPYQLQTQEVGYVSVPVLADRVYKSALLIDGSYGSPGIPRNQEITRAKAYEPDHIKRLAQLAAYFTYSAMGNSLKVIESQIPKVEEIFRDFLGHAAPPRFPGKVNPERAAQGQKEFNKNCASCHGIYDGDLSNIRVASFPNKLIPFEKIGSDNARWANLDAKVSKFAKKSKELSKFIAPISAQKGYVAPLLTGLWASAPYMHNGSVPDLWSFLNPEMRPAQFKVGGHALDFENMGIAYPDDYKPTSIPQVYDTTKNGRSNKGHEILFRSLSMDQKRSLLEYLKLL